MIILLTVGIAAWVVALCCLCYFVGRSDGERRHPAPWRDPRIDSGEIVEITLRAKDYVQIKRITPEDLERPERMAEVGRCMSFFYRTVDKL
jgi:hypothetical protein